MLSNEYNLKKTKLCDSIKWRWPELSKFLLKTQYFKHRLVDSL